MSSFMVSIDTMNNIINGLFWNHKFKDYYGGVYKEQNLNCEKDFIELAKKLFLLNKMALLQRYPNEKADSDYILIPKWQWENKQISDFQLLKSLHCLRYQCGEGNVPKKSLYKWLDNVIRSLESYIIHRIPEYDKARWD